MVKIGILAGGGELPLNIGKSLVNSNYDVFFFGIKDYFKPKLYKNYKFEIISIKSFSNLIRLLKKNNINKIVMAGNINRPSIKDINFDLNTLKIIKNFALDSKGDDKLLSAISIFFENQGFPLFDWKKTCKDLFCSEKNLTKNKPSYHAISNKNKGLEVFKIIGKADVAQSLIIQNNIILGIEAAEGTNTLIQRCSKYKKKGDKGILLKLSKYKQNSFLDIPVIGIETVKKIKKYNYEGIFLEKNKCVIINKDNVIDFSNKNKIFISTVEKN